MTCWPRPSSAIRLAAPTASRRWRRGEPRPRRTGADRLCREDLAHQLGARPRPDRNCGGWRSGPLLGGRRPLRAVGSASCRALWRSLRADAGGGADPPQGLAGDGLADLHRLRSDAGGRRRHRQDRHGRAALAGDRAGADPAFGDRQGGGDPGAGALLSRAAQGTGLPVPLHAATAGHDPGRGGAGHGSARSRHGDDGADGRRRVAVRGGRPDLDVSRRGRLGGRLSADRLVVDARIPAQTRAHLPRSRTAIRWVPAITSPSPRSPSARAACSARDS